MRRFAQAVLIVTLVAGCTSLRYDPDKVLYLRDKRAFPAHGVTAAVRDIVPQDKPVVLFVHGRGDEPAKSLEGTDFVSELLGVEGRAVHKIEDGYRVRVVLFSWDAQRGAGFLNLDFWDRCRPLETSVAAADRLRGVIESLDALPAGASRPRFVLLAHSMGAWVVKNYVEKYGPFPRGLFANVVLSSADVDNVGHADWVETLAQTARVYVTVNDADRILLNATSCRPQGAMPLGLAPGERRSRNARYVVFPSMSGHEVFYRSDWQAAERVRDFYEAVLSGGDY